MSNNVTTPKPLVIYHANCIDGFTAAYVFWTKFGDNADYLAASYGDDTPDVANRDVYIVDFSYPIDKMEEIIKAAHCVTWLDHHAPALATVSRLSKTYSFTQFNNQSNINKSGAMLAWEFVGGDADTLELVEYVQDMDLGKHALPCTREINAYIASVEFSFKNFAELEWDVSKVLDDRVIPCGEAILRNEAKLVKDLVNNYSYYDNIAGKLCLVCNAPRHLRNVVAEALCLKQLAELEDANLVWGTDTIFAATFYIKGTMKYYSLRSLDDGADVNAIANTFGGGGHKHAAGFKVTTI